MPNQYVNKVVYGGDTLIDLTTDTAVAADVQAGKYFHLKTGERVQGTCAYDMDTSTADATAAEILSGKKAGVNGNMVTGSMPNNGGTNVVVTSKTGTTIPQGYSDGSAKAVIDSASATALVAGNVREGIVILGITGTMSGSENMHPQSKNVTPSTSSQTITPDSPTYNCLSQVTVAAIPYTETDNSAGGKTVTIA